MISITDQIKEAAGDLLIKTPEIRNESSGFSMFNDGGVECEVGELLYGFVRVLKPSYVLETGTHKGIASSYIGMALKENRKDRTNGLIGLLETLEIEATHIETSKELWKKLGVNDIIIPYRTASLDYDPPHRFGMILLDTELNLRLHELVKFYKALEPGGYVFVHDMPPTLCKNNVSTDHPEIVNYPVGKFPPEFDEFLLTDKLRLIHFPSPRGLICFYKPKDNDYKWK